MKRFSPVILSIIFLYISQVAAQENRFEGNWLGNLKVSSVSLRIVLKITKVEKDNYKAILNSPDQTDKDIPVDKIVISGDSIKLFVKMIGGSYKGKIADTLDRKSVV